MIAPETKTSYTPALIILLIIGAFFLGSLVTKVQYLEKGTTQPQVAGAQAPQNQPVQQPQAQQPTGKIKPVADNEHIRGNKNAKITLVEYSDFECPFCKTFHPTTQDILKTYGDKVRLVYRHFPLPFHQNAQKEAESSECIAELGGNDAFWNFADKVFERTTSNGLGFALDKLGPLAAELGLDQAKFQSCLDSGKYTKLVQDEQADGTAGGVNGTPTTFIVDAKGKNQMIVGAQPIAAFKTAIDAALKN